MVEGSVERRWQRLATGDEGSATSAAVSVILFIVWFVLDHLFNNLLDIADFNEDVFGLKIGVNDAAFTVQVIEAEKHLLGDLLYEWHGDTTMVPSLD